MGIFSALFGKPADKVGIAIRENSTLVDTHMKSIHSDIVQYGDFTFEYLYTSNEPISSNGTYGSVIYIRVESPVHEFVSSLPKDFPEIQESIDKHQKQYSGLPNNISKQMTRWLYFNMTKNFRAC